MATPFNRRTELKAHLEGLFPNTSAIVTVDTPIGRTNGTTDGGYTYVIRLRGSGASLVTARELKLAMRAFDPDTRYVSR